MFGKILFKINLNFGRYIFRNPNNLYNNIFNFCHRILISKKTNNQNIKEFLNNGYSKIKINSDHFCDKVNDELKLQSPNDEKGYFHFEITNKIKNIIRNHINFSFKDLLGDFEYYFNANISVAKILIKRNYNIDGFNDEVYSNRYHVDHNTYNHFKLFINLMDTDKENGPLNIYSKNATKKFVKVNKYKNRKNYLDQDLKDLLYVNTGKKGDSLIADTSVCLHKAGKIEKGYFRDVVFITFITIPKKIIKKDFFYYEQLYPGIIWMPVGGSKVVKIAKPKTFRAMVLTFFNYYKSKLI